MVEQRGRKTAGDLMPVVVVGLEEKPAAPPDFGDEEKEIWDRTIAALPVRWFGREQWSVLINYCRHSFAADQAWLKYRKAIASKKKPEIIAQYAELFNRETRAVRQHSADLRLTKISRVRVESADRQKRNAVIKRPWDD